MAHLTTPPEIGARVSLRVWDRSERPRNRLGECVVKKVFRDRCPSGFMVTCENAHGVPITLDLHWLEAP